jgi:hypothetical protein
LKNKLKLKAKGKRFYQNTHGKVYRVKSSHKRREKILLMKRQRKVTAPAASVP